MHWSEEIAQKIIERNPEFLQLLVSVYANDLMSPYFPVGMTLVVERGKVK